MDLCVPSPCSSGLSCKCSHEPQDFTKNEEQVHVFFPNSRTPDSVLVCTQHLSASALSCICVTVYVAKWLCGGE